jgi:hypothetical protein
VSRGVICAVALLSTLAAAQPEFPSDHPREQYRVPNRFLVIDVLDMGVIAPWNQWPGFSSRAATFTYIRGPARFGLGVAEACTSPYSWDFWAVLPVHIGATLWSVPKPTGSLWAEPADIHVDLSGSLWQAANGSWNSWPWPARLERHPFVNLALCCDADYYGVGVGARAGVYRYWTGGVYTSTNGAVYFEFRLRFGVLRFAL